MRAAERIAILLAAYNGARYLETQLESLRTQTVQEFVCYIHDDGSDDGTQQIAASYCSRYPEHFIYLGSSRTGGSKYNFMYLLREVEADYIMFCDQDDVWLPEKVEKTYLAMRQAQEQTGCADAVPVCVFSDLMVVDAQLKVVNPSFYAYSSKNPERTSLRQLLYNNVAPGCTMMINAPLRRLMLAADVADKIHMHDWLAMLLASAAGKIVFINESLIWYRQHGDNAIGATRRRSLPQKLRKLFRLKSWTLEKRHYFENLRGNAQAVLLCLEAGNDVLLQDFEAVVMAEESKNEIRHFISRFEGPFLVRLLRLYMDRNRLSE